MSTYGLIPTPGSIPFTGWSNTLGVGQASNGVQSGAVYSNGIYTQDSDIARVFRNSAGSGAASRILLSLLGAAAGGSALKTFARVQGQPQLFVGGAVPIETINLVNRNTTAADVTAFTALVNRVPAPSSYPRDVSGNGGGGKGAW